jgi:hypothetical protein
MDQFPPDSRARRGQLNALPLDRDDWDPAVG